jgi:hypothetical protein
VRGVASRADQRLRRRRCVECGRAPQAREVIRQVERDAAVAFAERLEAAPDDFASSEERVEVRALIVLDARGQDFRFDA